MSAAEPPAPYTDLTGRADPARHAVSFGSLRLIGPPGRPDGTPLGWRHGPRELGADPPEWW